MNIQEDRDRAREIAWLNRIVDDLVHGKFYGRLDITFHSGRIQHIERYQKNLPPTRGRE